MKRAAILLALTLLSACGLRPLYSNGSSGPVAQTLGAVEVAPIEGRAGWLVSNALKDRFAAGGASAPRYRLEIRLDDDITGLGIRRDDSVTRERRTLRARYQLVEVGSGAVVLDATAGSDAGIDVVSSEYATIAAESTALERLSEIVADQIVARIALYARREGQAPGGDAVKASEAQARAALDRPSPDIRVYLLHGPDEAGAMALADRLARTMGPEAERVDLDGATLKADPARLVDEAASLSLFGGARHIRATGVGDESLAAVTALLDADRAGNPAVLIAPTLRKTSALVKLALAAPRALAFACYAPVGRDAEALAINLAREHGLRAAGNVARRLSEASGGDRAVVAREIEKLALYLDAAPDRPRTLDDSALDAVGADLGEAEMGRAIAAVIAGRAGDLAEELARLSEAGVSPVAWLRQLARRLASLAEMRAEVEAGEDTAGVMKRHRVFFREEAGTRDALARWSPTMLAAAHARFRAAERAVMAASTAGNVLADRAVLDITRRLGGR